jgi:hypothetical protein
MKRRTVRSWKENYQEVVLRVQVIALLNNPSAFLEEVREIALQPKRLFSSKRLTFPLAFKGSSSYLKRRLRDISL